mgnify:CR=1 FL=1
MSSLSGKKGVILGVGNQRSIAWAVAEHFHQEGAELALTYLTDPKGRFEAHLQIHVGSVDEEQTRGLAHLTEHVCFLGSSKRQKLNELGAEANAVTDFHATVYHVNAPTSTSANSKEKSKHKSKSIETVLDALSDIAFRSNLENEIQSLKTTLSKRIKEVYLKQREVDGCLLKIEKLQKQVEDNSSILETTKKEKLTVQADFEKEQSHFEEAMADFHKDIEKLEKDNRRLKRLVKKGGFGGADVMGSPSVAGSPMTPIGSSNAVTTSAISAASTFSNATLQNALQNSMKKSLHWRKLAMKSKLANQNQTFHVLGVLEAAIMMGKCFPLLLNLAGRKIFITAVVCLPSKIDTKQRKHAMKHLFIESLKSKSVSSWQWVLVLLTIQQM